VKFIISVIILCSSWVFVSSSEGIEKPIVVLIASYNNEIWCAQNLNSVFDQEYTNYRVIYIDDCSTDNTLKRVKELVEYKNQQNKFTLIENKKQKKAMRNFYTSIHKLTENNEIIVILDGDDWFYDNQALQIINKAYSSDEVWLTHGSLIEWPTSNIGWSVPIPEEIVDKNTFRKFRCPSHTRTFYSWLFKMIKKADLYYEGDFCDVTCDMAQMFPLIEMAGDRHAFISDITYVYNTATPNSDNKLYKKRQREVDEYLRAKSPYRRLKDKNIK